MDTGEQATVWRELAKQAAAAAARLHDPEARLSMLAIAAGYETMARHADVVPHQAEPPAECPEAR